MMQEFFCKRSAGCAGGFAVPGMTGGGKSPPPAPPAQVRGERRFLVDEVFLLLFVHKKKILPCPVDWRRIVRAGDGV